MAENWRGARSIASCCLSGQSAESSLPENPARTLTVASCRVTELQPIAQSSRLQNNGQGARRGSMATNKRARPAIMRNNSPDAHRRNGGELHLTMTTSAGAGVCGQSKMSATTASARQPSDAKAASVCGVMTLWRSSNVTLLHSTCPVVSESRLWPVRAVPRRRGTELQTMKAFAPRAAGNRRRPRRVR